MADPNRTQPVPGDWLFVASLQPSTHESVQPGYLGLYLTPARKLQFVNNYLRDGLGPRPICATGTAGHAPTHGPDQRLLEQDVVGYMTGVAYDPADSNLLMTGFVKKERPEAQRSFRAMMVDGVPLGVSAGTRYHEIPGRKGDVEDASKEIMHVAMTPVPDMADDGAEGSFIHWYTTSPEALARLMSTELARGVVANASSMDAWCIPPGALQEQSLSVLRGDISRAAAAGAIIPTPVDRQSMSGQPPPPTQPPTQPPQTTQPPPPATQQKPQPPPQQPPRADKMDTDAPAGSTSTTPPPKTPEQVAQDIFEGIKSGMDEIDRLDKESRNDDNHKLYAKKERLEYVLGEADKFMDQHKVDARKHHALLDAYTRMRNEIMAIDEKFKTLIREEGGAADHQNQALFDEYANPATEPGRRRGIAQMVTASRLGRRQKEVEAELLKERELRKQLEEAARTKDEQLSKKRKAEDDDLQKQVLALHEEVARLSKRQQHVAPLTAPPGATGPSLNFLQGFNPAYRPADAMDLDPPAGAPPQRSAASSPFVITGGEQRDASSKSGAPNFLGGMPTGGFVTASGFSMMQGDLALGARMTHPLLSKFMINPEESSWKHAGDPVFQRTFDAVRHQVASTGSSGLVFINDGSNRGTFGGSEISKKELLASIGQ
jgi:hypothetical protein